VTADRYRWAAGSRYDGYIGRWSRLVAAEFVRWLELPPLVRVLDVGCGTGALTATVLDVADPAEVIGVDPSEGYLAQATATVSDRRARFEVAAAESLPLDDASFDVVVSGLVLNFVSDPAVALGEAVRVVRRGGTVAAYVWDYAAGMQLLRHFWDAARAIDPHAAELDEGRFRICDPAELERVFAGACLEAVEARAIVVPSVFRDFDDYWEPFLSGEGPAPGYAMSLDDADRTALRDELRRRLPAATDGSIRLTARAWAVRGTKGER
jgi:SAM-dependent methyltransferase